MKIFKHESDHSPEQKDGDNPRRTLIAYESKPKQETQSNSLVLHKLFYLYRLSLRIVKRSNAADPSRSQHRQRRKSSTLLVYFKSWI